MVVDEIEGTMHQVYGGLADPALLIDAEGRIAYAALWTHVPRLHRAIATLLSQGGSGVVRPGVSRRPQVGPTVTDGWRAIQRGAPQSARELNRLLPGSSAVLRMGRRLRWLLAPITLRSAPIPRSVSVTIALGLVTILGLYRRRRAISATSGHEA